MEKQPRATRAVVLPVVVQMKLFLRLLVIQRKIWMIFQKNSCFVLNSFSGFSYRPDNGNNAAKTPMPIIIIPTHPIQFFIIHSPFSCVKPIEHSQIPKTTTTIATTIHIIQNLRSAFLFILLHHLLCHAENSELIQYFCLIISFLPFSFCLKKKEF